MTRADGARWRAELFRHLDGLATAPTAFALHERGVLGHLLEHRSAGLAELTAAFGANEGYLNVGLRVLASQGWLTQDLDNAADRIRYEVTVGGAAAFPRVPLYADAVRLLKLTERYHDRRFEVEPFRAMQEVFAGLENRCGLAPDAVGPVERQILGHIEGIIVAPTAVHLGMSGMFHKYFMEASFRPEEFHRDPASFGQLLAIFTRLGWFEERNGTFRFTDKGLFLAQRASAYGVTVSYIPTLRKLDALMFGDPLALRPADGGPERHVDREMNVWGSGGAHATYFRKVDEIIIELFNRPLAEQPRGILDLGCGNGAFLKHVYEVIERQTLRGRHLGDQPLFLVGVDYNAAALKVARHNLIQADIWAKVMWGDIGRPETLAASLRADYGIELPDLLNVRTFLDHNRIWEPPAPPPAGRVAASTGAFAHEGRRLPNALVEESLVQHLRKWAPYVGRFGLLVIELHTLPPAVTATHLGETAATAYDATHGFSDQYIVEVDVFHRAVREAGLEVVPEHLSLFPSRELATVSINLLRAPGR
ncbi:MAG: class I SAM-dependent methyltransferase [Gemmatimonadales bacterium]